MDPLQLIMKKRIQRANKALQQKQRTLNYSTTSVTNRIYQSIPSSINNSNYEEQLKKFEEYSKYHFISNNYNNYKLNEKSGLSLLKNGINSIINDNNNKKNYYIKLSPIKRKGPLYNPISSNRTFKKINLRNALFGNNINKNSNNISIWEKLKNSESMKESYKYARSNIRENIKRYEYMEKQRNINKLKNKSDLEKEHINGIKKLYLSEKNFLEKTKQKLKKSYEKIKNVYEDNAQSQVSFIFTTEIKESSGNNKLVIDKKQLKKEVSILESEINILKEEKNKILNWVYLLIKIKENKKVLPKYYMDIIDKNSSFDILIKKYNNLKLSKEEYNKINSYKKSLVFNDISEFSDKLNSLNNRIILFLNESNKKRINKDGKIISDAIKKDMMPNDEEKKLKQELDELKYKNNKLKEIYNNKIKYNKKRRKKSNGKLFQYIIELFEEFKKLKFSKIEIRINFLDKEEKIILDIIQCFEINLNYLLLEKNRYNSNEELKEVYKTAENKIKKENIYIKFIKQQKINKKILEAKKEKIQKRLNKIDYSLNKKVDFDNYLRVLNKLNKTVKKEEDQDEINRQFILYS